MENCYSSYDGSYDNFYFYSDTQSYDYDEMNHISVSKYNSKGHQTEYGRYHDSISTNTLEMKFEMAYDEKGNIIKNSEYEKKSNRKLNSIFTYLYDKNGNWVRGLWIGTDRALTIRVIEYYWIR